MADQVIQNNQGAQQSGQVTVPVAQTQGSAQVITPIPLGTTATQPVAHAAVPIAPVVIQDSPVAVTPVATPTHIAPVQTVAATKTVNDTLPSVTVDTNKTNEQYIIEAESEYIIPDLVRQKYPDLIKLVYETESMNNEEREYWLQILPIMGEDQIVKFRQILVDEKEQLQKLDDQYQEKADKYGASKAISEDEMKKRMQDIKEKETQSEIEEQQKEAELLNMLNGL